MAVKLISTDEEGVGSWLGLTADTTAWLEANKTKVSDGSLYRELDGAKRAFQILNGVWYEL